MRLNVELGDQKVAMVLDTGATSSLITACLHLATSKTIETTMSEAQRWVQA